jgi:hypothetical protein
MTLEGKMKRLCQIRSNEQNKQHHQLGKDDVSGNACTSLSFVEDRMRRSATSAGDGDEF